MAGRLDLIRFRFQFNLDYGVVSRYNKFFVSAETYNDIIGFSYEKLLGIANEESIDFNQGNVNLEYFYYNNKYDFQIHVPKKKYDSKINQDHCIFHISLIWDKHQLKKKI